MGQTSIKGHTVLYSDEHQKYIDDWNWYIHKTKHGFYARGYKKGSRSGGLFYMHRLIMDAQKGSDVDHVNGNGLDNRFENLRICDRTQNNGNRRKIKEKSSKFKGVHFDKWSGKWRAEVSHMGERHRLGRFDSQEEAVSAYYSKAKELFDEYAKLAVKSPAQNELDHQSHCP